VPDKLSHKDVATALLLLHGRIFSDESLVGITKLCEIHFINESDHATAMWEWFYFGLYTVVQGAWNNLRGKPEIGKAVVREIFSELRSHLLNAGITAKELDVKLVEIKERFTQFDAIFATGEYERMGHCAAAFVLGLKLAPAEKFPRTPEAFAFGLAASQSYLGTLKAANELFDSIKFLG